MNDKIYDLIDRVLISVDSNILKRGSRVYKSGLVRYINKLDNNIFAYVSSENYYNPVAYEVNLVLKNDELDMVSCNCPYYAEYGSVCKHIVAVLLELQSILKEENIKEIEKLIDNLPVDELREYFKDILIFDKSFREKLLRKNSFKILKEDKDDLNSYYKTLFNKIFYNFIRDLNESYDYYYYEGLEDFQIISDLEDIYTKISDENEKLIFFKVFFKNYISLIYIDEEIFLKVNEQFLEYLDKFFIDVLKDLLNSPETNSEALRFLCVDINFDLYPEYNYINIFYILADYINSKEDVNTFLDCLDRYNIKDEKILSKVYKKFFPEKYKKLVEENKFNSSFIQLDYVNYLLKQNKLIEVNEFLKSIANYVESLENLEFFITLDIDNELKKRFYRKLILNHLKLEYLDDYKKYFNSDEWKEELDKIKKYFEKKDYYCYLVELLIHENQLREALFIIESYKTSRDCIFYITETYKEKFIEFKDRFIGIIFNVANSKIEKEKSRENYQKVMNYLKNFVKIPEYKEGIIHILDRLKKIYPKRRVLLEEIEKLRKSI